MNMTRFWILSALILLFVAENLWAKVPACKEPPAFLSSRGEDVFDSSRLPERVLVARSVEVWADNKERGLQLLAKHDFKSMKSEVRCSKAPVEGSVNLSVWVPALIDLSREKKWGDSVWQVQILSELKRVGIWSQKSRLAPADEAKKILQKGTWRSLGSDAYELIIENPREKTQVVYRVLFDVMDH